VEERVGLDMARNVVGLESLLGMVKDELEKYIGIMLFSKGP
jgi:hypothetical protein